ncbi:Probable aspartic proteinase GIP2 [Linum grandiflorum]
MAVKHNNPLIPTLTLVFTIILIISFSPSITQQSLLTLYNPTKQQLPLHLPVWKDSKTLQYVTEIKQRTPTVAVNLTLDIGGRHLWVDCDQPYTSTTYSPASCNSPQCSLIAESNSCFNDCFFGPSQPGCYNDTCGVVIDNSVAGIVAGGQVGQDVLYAYSGQPEFGGTKLVRHPGFVFTCGMSYLLEGLAESVSGMAGFGTTEMSFPSQFSSAFGINRTFALCLGPTTGSVVFPSTITDLEAVKSLVFTPLLTNPVSTATAYSDGEPSAEYFIGIKEIKVDGTPIKANSTLLSINDQGYGGTKISTIHPYTVLQSSIYDAVLSAFVNQSARVHYNMRRVVWAGPFGACFDTSRVRITRVGPIVPMIEIQFENDNVSWQMFGANSMVPVADDVMCLGMVDGGATPRTSIVIGGHQLENHLVVFDVERKLVGFGSSLLGQGKSCDRFVKESTSRNPF